MAACKEDSDCFPADRGSSVEERDSVVYIHSVELMRESDKNPQVSGRVRIAIYL